MADAPSEYRAAELGGRRKKLEMQEQNAILAQKLLSGQLMEQDSTEAKTKAGSAATTHQMTGLGAALASFYEKQEDEEKHKALEEAEKQKAQEKLQEELEQLAKEAGSVEKNKKLSPKEIAEKAIAKVQMVSGLLGLEQFDDRIVKIRQPMLPPMDLGDALRMRLMPPGFRPAEYFSSNLDQIDNIIAEFVDPENVPTEGALDDEEKKLFFDASKLVGAQTALMKTCNCGQRLDITVENAIKKAELETRVKCSQGFAKLVVGAVTMIKTMEAAMNDRDNQIRSVTAQNMMLMKKVQETREHVEALQRRDPTSSQTKISDLEFLEKELRLLDALKENMKAPIAYRRPLDGVLEKVFKDDGMTPEEMNKNAKWVKRVRHRQRVITTLTERCQHLEKQQLELFDSAEKEEVEVECMSRAMQTLPEEEVPGSVAWEQKEALRREKEGKNIRRGVKFVAQPHVVCNSIDVAKELSGTGWDDEKIPKEFRMKVQGLLASAKDMMTNMDRLRVDITRELNPLLDAKNESEAADLAMDAQKQIEEDLEVFLLNMRRTSAGLAEQFKQALEAAIPPPPIFVPMVEEPAESEEDEENSESAAVSFRTSSTRRSFCRSSTRFKGPDDDSFDKLHSGIEKLKAWIENRFGVEIPEPLEEEASNSSDRAMQAFRHLAIMNLIVDDKIPLPPISVDAAVEAKFTNPSKEAHVQTDECEKEVQIEYRVPEGAVTAEEVLQLVQPVEDLKASVASFIIETQEIAGFELPETTWTELYQSHSQPEGLQGTLTLLEIVSNWLADALTGAKNSSYSAADKATRATAQIEAREQELLDDKNQLLQLNSSLWQQLSEAQEKVELFAQAAKEARKAEVEARDAEEEANRREAKARKQIEEMSRRESESAASSREALELIKRHKESLSSSARSPIEVQAPSSAPAPAPAECKTPIAVSGPGKRAVVLQLIALAKNMQKIVFNLSQRIAMKDVLGLPFPVKLLDEVSILERLFPDPKGSLDSISDFAGKLAAWGETIAQICDAQPHLPNTSAQNDIVGSKSPISQSTGKPVLPREGTPKSVSQRVSPRTSTIGLESNPQQASIAHIQESELHLESETRVSSLSSSPVSSPKRFFTNEAHESPTEVTPRSRASSRKASTPKVVAENAENAKRRISSPAPALRTFESVQHSTPIQDAVEARGLLNLARDFLLELLEHLFHVKPTELSGDVSDAFGQPQENLTAETVRTMMNFARQVRSQFDSHEGQQQEAVDILEMTTQTDEGPDFFENTRKLETEAEEITHLNNTVQVLENTLSAAEEKVGTLLLEQAQAQEQINQLVAQLKQQREETAREQQRLSETLTDDVSICTHTTTVSVAVSPFEEKELFPLVRRSSRSVQTDLTTVSNAESMTQGQMTIAVGTVTTPSLGPLRSPAKNLPPVTPTRVLQTSKNIATRSPVQQTQERRDSPPPQPHLPPVLGGSLVSSSPPSVKHSQREGPGAIQMDLLDPPPSVEWKEPRNASIVSLKQVDSFRISRPTSGVATAQFASLPEEPVKAAPAIQSIEEFVAAVAEPEQSISDLVRQLSREEQNEVAHCLFGTDAFAMHQAIYRLASLLAKRMKLSPAVFEDPLSRSNLHVDLSVDIVELLRGDGMLLESLMTLLEEDSAVAKQKIKATFANVKLRLAAKRVERMRNDRTKAPYTLRTQRETEFLERQERRLKEKMMWLEQQREKIRIQQTLKWTSFKAPQNRQVMVLKKVNFFSPEGAGQTAAPRATISGGWKTRAQRQFPTIRLMDSGVADDDFMELFMRRVAKWLEVKQAEKLKSSPALVRKLRESIASRESSQQSTTTRTASPWRESQLVNQELFRRRLLDSRQRGLGEELPARPGSLRREFMPPLYPSVAGRLPLDHTTLTPPLTAPQATAAHERSYALSNVMKNAEQDFASVIPRPIHGERISQPQPAVFSVLQMPPTASSKARPLQPNVK